MNEKKRLRVGFLWFGLDGRYGQWNDGLRAAMRLIEKEHEVHYFDTVNGDWSQMDVLLFWEATCTALSKDKDEYFKVQLSPQPKILLFAGGPIEKKGCDGFDLFMVESKINEEEFEKLGLPWMRGFGVNTEVMKPEKQPKIFDSYFPSTCASWKRQALYSRALGPRAALSGRFQEHDQSGFMEARKNGVFLLPELSYPAVAAMYNASACCVNTSAYWGGGQRSTLEAMACGIPVIAMSDSPKNREYVEESGCGIVCDPTESAIRAAVGEILQWDEEATRNRCLRYIRSKWTERHYADAILKGIEKVSKKL